MDNVSIKAVSKIVRANIDSMSDYSNCWWADKIDRMSDYMAPCTLEEESTYDETGDIHRFRNPQKYKKSFDLKLVTIFRPITMYESTHRSIINKDDMYCLIFGD